MKEEILKLRKEGKSYNEIQAILGCSKSTISYHCGNGQKEKSKNRLSSLRNKKNKIKVVENQSMDDKTWIGGLSELKVMTELSKQKFYVFNQISGKAPFDLIAYKGNKLFRISVKGSYRSAIKGDRYEIQIGRVRSNKNKNIVYKFNHNECDIVAVYIHEIDKVCFINSMDIKNGRIITLRESISKYSNSSNLNKAFIIDELKEIKNK